MTTMEDYLGKDIGAICKNGFDDATLNHCAHFVSHAKGLGFHYHCKEHMNGTHDGANIRVHEIFAKCADVGDWPAPGGGDALIFVTAKKNVDLAKKEMKNVPKKHIGVFENGVVYHYSNTRDEVVKQTVPAFQKAFDKSYGGPQGYF